MNREILSMFFLSMHDEWESLRFFLLDPFNSYKGISSNTALCQNKESVWQPSTTKVTLVLSGPFQSPQCSSSLSSPSSFAVNKSPRWWMNGIRRRQAEQQEEDVVTRGRKNPRKARLWRHFSSHELILCLVLMLASSSSCYIYVHYMAGPTVTSLAILLCNI